MERSREFLSGLSAFLRPLMDLVVATGRRIHATASMGGTGDRQIGRVGGPADWRPEGQVEPASCFSIADRGAAVPPEEALGKAKLGRLAAPPTVTDGRKESWARTGFTGSTGWGVASIVVSLLRKPDDWRSVYNGWHTPCPPIMHNIPFKTY